MSRSPRDFVPQRIVVGAAAHAEIADRIRALRPTLEIRGGRQLDISAADLEWADAFIGFRRPPTGTLGKVRWVHCTGAGVDAWMTPEIDRDILLTRTPESFGPAIAEWAITRMLASRQQLRDLDRAQSERRWAPRDIQTLRGTRALLVGTGDVGSAVARMLRTFGVNITGVSRTGRTDEPAFDAVYPTTALPHLVGHADWIVLTLPITPATRGLFSRDVMANCRGGYLLNAGRGAVVDETALIEAFDRGWLSGAALDVFETEPLPETSPLWAHPLVTISPHISGLTTVAGAAEGFMECVHTLESGMLPRWTVDRDRGY